MKCLLLVTNVPTPYRLPFFEELARQARDAGFSLKVLFGRTGYARREWNVDLSSVKFDYEVLAGRAIGLGSHERYTFTYPGLLRRIIRDRPAVVIVAGFSIATVLLRILRAWRNVPFLIWSGEIRRQSAWRERLRRWLIRGASGYIAYGSAAKRYLENLGASPKRISVAINTVDTHFFGSLYARRDVADGRSRKHLLLCVAALAAGKQLETLMHLAKALSARRSDFEISIIGSGPERAALESLARDLNVDHVVRFAGYLQRQDVGEALTKATVFLFPSRYDIWGLVLVEAMAAGVPCIASIHSGATEDLIEDGVTGYAVDFLDTVAVRERVEDLLDDPIRTHAMSAAAHRVANEHASLRVSAEGAMKAVSAVCEMRR